MNATKIPVLKISFIKKLNEIWQNEYADEYISKFINFINQEYGSSWKDFCAPGETGIYIDSDIKFKLNTHKRAGKEKALFDKEYAYLLFDGLFALDDDNNRVPLNEVQASDIRMWNCLSLFILKDYSIERWGHSKDSARIFINALTNGKISRHSISRLYWSARLCFDDSRNDKLELLEVLWKTQDFYTAISERSFTGMRKSIKVFLDFCNKKEYKSEIFDSNSIEGYKVYRKLVKLFLADSNVMAISFMEQDALEKLFEENLVACTKTVSI